MDLTEINETYLKNLIKMSREYTNEEIEATLIEYVCREKNSHFYYCSDFDGYRDLINDELLNTFSKINLPLDIELFVEFFEALLDRNNIEENGIVFTPKYIAEHIVKNTLQLSRNINIIDPGCGCGIFLVSAAEYIHKNTNLSYVEIFNKHIFGIDIVHENARRCKLILNLFVVLNDESNSNLHPNIACCDSLKSNWCQLFNVQSFDYIIGNPPYVNTHDMNKETATFLKKTFSTTQQGVYNIFYAFIEHAMSFLDQQGCLGYIIPNNFLTIKSAQNLREFLTFNKYIHRIIDFADNMVFKPVRTYNAILFLDKQEKECFEYAVLDKCDDINNKLNTLTFETMLTDKLDKNGWKLVSKTILKNLDKIESQFYNISDFIRTGIATLRDEIYMVNRDDNGFYKNIDGVSFRIESDIVKRLYKVPDLKNCNDIDECCRYIIFPYKKTNTTFEIIPENEFKNSFPQAYEYLCQQKESLSQRDKGKPNTVAWYAYGRTQGLNKYGEKILFPTFAGYPRFTLIRDSSALFCNGYAIFENDYIELSLLVKILNSDVMQYYITNTSYAIEGGYYCYQKKYIEKFSIPMFSDEEIDKINSMSNEQFNRFLINKYGININ